APAAAVASAGAAPAHGAVTREAAGAVTSGNLSQLLPDDEGKGLVLGTCVQCHNLRYVVDLRKDAAEWRRCVDDMIARGAQLTASEAEVMVRYLARHRARGGNGK
ncbi:MAG: hypothetical protein ACRD68_10315, partial [Pyrinomonadaceae bacterium]